MKTKHISSERIFEQQIDTLFRTTQTGGLANIFSSFLVYSMLYSSHSISALVLTLLISGLSLLRIIISKNYLHTEKKRNVISHLSTYLGLTFLIGCSWGGIIVLQSMQPDIMVSNIIYLINFGLIAGSLVTLSSWFPAYLSYVIPQSLPIFGVLAAQDSDLSIYYALAFAVFISIMISGSSRFHKSFVKNLLLKMDLEESRQDLEEKVWVRTKELERTNIQLRDEITQKNKAKRDLEYLAFNDELTGLPKRNVLIDHINSTITTAKRNNYKMALLFLDLDGFKKINDTLGHIVGDELIVQVSERLKSVLREEDVVSRNGGDEFVVLIKEMRNSDQVIKVINKLIASISSNYIINSHNIHIGVSIGVSIFPSDGYDGLQLLKNADTAMYKAKKLGGNQYHFYDHSMSQRLSHRLKLESSLHSALKNNEMFMMYQPQYDSISGAIVGYEALLRWRSKEFGAVSPEEFVPLLEDTGLIYSTGKWIISTVIGQIAAINCQVPISINLSPLQCRDLTLVEYIAGELNSFAIDSSLLEFEITESQLISDFDKTETFLHRLLSIGCSVSLDDFGTGYTSLNYLAMLPINSIKIDKSFVRNIDRSEKLKNIVSAIINMSKSLGIDNVFEGVETERELKVIENLGGRFVQGNLFSEPLTSIEILEKSYPGKLLHLNS